MHAARCGGDSAASGSSADLDAPTCISAGSTSLHSSTARGQRGTNGQPGGRSMSSGGLPSIGTSGAPRVESTRGIAPSNPIV